MTSQVTSTVFDALGNFGESLSRLDIFGSPSANLAMYLSRETILAHKIVIHSIEVTFLLIRSAKGILVLVFHLFASGIFSIREQLRDGYARRCGLRLVSSGSLLLLLGLLLLFLLDLSSNGATSSARYLMVVVIGFIMFGFAIFEMRLAVGSSLAAVAVHCECVSMGPLTGFTTHVRLSLRMFSVATAAMVATGNAERIGRT